MEITIPYGDEQVTFVRLGIRTRWKRAARWPLIYWQMKRIPGVSWAMAWKLTHWTIWYEVKATYGN